LVDFVTDIRATLAAEPEKLQVLGEMDEPPRRRRVSGERHTH
jgi:hypothetical protein